MCGITGGIWRGESDCFTPELLNAMTDSLAHRGPDGRGVYWHDDARGGVALGHRRLAIIDISEQGRQPIFNEDGSIIAVCNGEIYNDRAEREILLSRGHIFRGAADTEIIVHLYEEYGDDFLSRLNGMFALALWDAKRRRLLLARDRLGKKPLYYAAQENRLFFGSEMKAIFASQQISRKLDRVALDLYLTYQYIPHPHTIEKTIRKLPPAHFLVWECEHAATQFGTYSAPKINRYWEIPRTEINREEITDLSKNEWTHSLQDLLRDAVKIRTRSDVPIGAFLSGGIDSSITAGLMQQCSSSPIETFSVGFAYPEYDETQYAAILAKQLGTKHHAEIFDPTAETFSDLLPKLVWHYDEPFSDSSMIPTWFLSEMTRRNVTVALSGDGGDELFAGYLRYRAMQLGDYANFLPLALRKIMAGMRLLIPNSVRQHSWRRRLRRLLEAIAMPPTSRYLQWIAIFSNARRQELYTSDAADALAASDDSEQVGEAFLEAAFASLAPSFSRDTISLDTITRWSFTDLVTYLPGDLMTKVDVASMAHGLECRCPMLDYRVVELAARMPSSLKVRGKRGKVILREAFADLLPAEIENRSKRGFGAPLDHWLRGVWRDAAREQLFDSPQLYQFFRREAIEKLWHEHQTCRFDHAARLWSLLILSAFLK